MRSSFVLIISAFLFGFSALGATTYKVDPKKSEIKWVGKKVTGQHDGTLQLKSGEFSVDDKGSVSGKFVVDMTSIKVLDIEDPEYNKKLKDHLESDDFFSVKKHPTATFELKSSKKTGKDTYEFGGDLTIKGIKKPINFTGKLHHSANKAHVEADLKIDRTKWDVKYNSGKFFDIKKLGDKLIDDEISIGLNVHAMP